MYGECTKGAQRVSRDCVQKGMDGTQRAKEDVWKVYIGHRGCMKGCQMIWRQASRCAEGPYKGTDCMWKMCRDCMVCRGVQKVHRGAQVCGGVQRVHREILRVHGGYMEGYRRCVEDVQREHGGLIS